MPSLTLNAALRLITEEIGISVSELRILTEHTTGLGRVAQMRDPDTAISMDQVSSLKSLAQRRMQGEPIAYLVGQKEFYSRPFKVDPRVLIPRPETEELVEHALGFLQDKSNENLLTRVLDIGTGSGAIAISIALENPILDVLATDISAEALALAQDNANTLKAKNVRFLQSDLFENLLNQQPPLAFDLVCSNPPYIEAGDSHLSLGDLRFEPQDALTDHGDGLHFYRQIAQHCPAVLRSGGGVLVEHGYNQQAALLELFRQIGYRDVQGLNDLAGTPRFVFARLGA